jgi:diacylglycerol O-acyltransferase
MREPLRALGRYDERLSPLDAAFLYLEQPTELFHVGAVSILDGSVPFEPFAAMVGERLGALRRYRQRPVRPLLDLMSPAWEEDPRFDPRQHIRPVAVEAPGGEAELGRVVDDLFARRIDANRPLWEIYLLDGLADGHSAILSKVHHCMIDGVSGAQILDLMTDPSSEAGSALFPHQAPPPAPQSAPEGRWIPRGLRNAIAVAGKPGLVLAGARQAAGAAALIADLLRDPIQPMPFNGRLTGARRIVWASFPLDDFLAMRGAAGCKVNDVVLAVITGALRRYLPAAKVAGYGSRLRALIPVSIRREDEHLALGNRVSVMFAHLPIGVADPLDRLRCVADEMRQLKERGQRQAFDAILAFSGMLPTPVGSLLTRLSAGGMTTPIVHTVCTNIPGSRERRYVLGRPIVDVHPIVPLAAGVGLGFAILSYGGKISIAATADAGLVPDAERVREALFAAHDELRKHLDVGPQRSPAAQPGPTVAQLMTRDVVTVWAHDRLDRPWEVMQVRRIRHLPVLDDKNRLIGLVTHRDLLAASQSSLSFTNEAERVLGWAHVADVMETHLSTASPEEPAAEAGRRMVRHKIGCLLVVDEGGRLVGIVTEEDFLRWATEHMGAPDTAGDPGRGRNFADVTGGRSEPGATSATIRRSG